MESFTFSSGNMSLFISATVWSEPYSGLAIILDNGSKFKKSRVCGLGSSALLLGKYVMACCMVLNSDACLRGSYVPYGLNPGGGSMEWTVLHVDWYLCCVLLIYVEYRPWMGKMSCVLFPPM